MDADVRELFARSVHDATDKCSGAALDAALANVGWHDALAVHPRDAVSILFERQGASNTTSSSLGAVVVDALGSTAAGVVLPTIGLWRAPASRVGERFVVAGLTLGTHDRVLVVAEAGHADHVATVVAATELEVHPVHGLDPSLGLHHVRAEVDADDAQPVAWSTAVASGQRAIAHELIGASRTMLELARLHALERVQFGRPIAMFQAVRHRLADTLVAIETADAALDAAWEDPTPHNAAVAKALAGRGAHTAARHCQQVLAGIGFTTEHPLHRYIRRALVLDQLLGSSKLLTRELGEHLIRTRTLPPVLPL